MNVGNINMYNYTKQETTTTRSLEPLYLDTRIQNMKYCWQCHPVFTKNSRFDRIK